MVYDGDSSKWVNRTLTKSDVGLDNVDNTPDAQKNVATAGSLSTARDIELTGDATGTTSFDGSSNVSIEVSVLHSDSAAAADHASSADSATNAEHADSADSATKATQDASGNVITEVYATKTEVTAATLKWQTF